MKKGGKVVCINKSAKKKETKQVIDTNIRALRISEARYRRLFETAQDGILIIDAASGQISQVNPFMAGLLGYTRQNFIGKALWEFGPFKNIREIRSAFQELLSTGYIHYERLPMETKDGKCIEVEFISNLYQVGPKKWIQCNIRDISKRKPTEINNFDLRLVPNKNQKIASIATLASGVAHKFNNTLTVITTALSLLEDTDTDQEVRDYYQLMHEASDQMSDLTEKLLIYAMRDNHRLETIWLNDLITENLPFFRSAVKSSITIETKLQFNLPQIKADRNQILMVLENIIINASEAIENRGVIRINCCTEMMTAEETKETKGFAQGYYVNLTITDTGKGMDEKTLKRVFEPFFTTHFLGCGLGMAVVFGIVKTHGGRIFIKSHIDQGTTVHIYLPAICFREKASMPSEEKIRQSV